MDFKPYLKKLKKAETHAENAQVLGECAVALLYALFDEINPSPVVFEPCIIAALKCIEKVFVDSLPEDDREKVLNVSKVILDSFEVQINRSESIVDEGGKHK